VILPGAIASAVTMALLGRFASRFDARPLITIGALGFLWCMWKLSNLTYDTGAADLFWPLVARGVSLGLIFIPLTGASMAELTPGEIPQGTGMFNLTRQLGGSLGIAVLATTLQRWTTEGKQVLTEHLTTTGSDVMARLDLLTRGMVTAGANPATAHQQALMIMDRMVGAQASVLAFSRVYMISGLALCCCIPMMLFWRHGRLRSAVHAH
jgi:DHA2 family multidrug resistance protein